MHGSRGCFGGSLWLWLPTLQHSLGLLATSCAATSISTLWVTVANLCLLPATWSLALEFITCTKCQTLNNSNHASELTRVRIDTESTRSDSRIARNSGRAGSNLLGYLLGEWGATYLQQCRRPRHHKHGELCQHVLEESPSLPL